jgi:hypothetical protein
MRRAKFLAVLSAVFLILSSFIFAEDALPEFVAKHRVSLWTFESGTTEGWHGTDQWAKACSVISTPKGETTGGKYRLKVDLTGSAGWNQTALVNDGPFVKDVNKLVELDFDIDVPEASAKGLEYQQVCLVLQGKANAWYQLGNKDVNVGKNTVKYEIDPTKIKGDPGDMWHIVIVFNNTQPFKGPVYIDNIVGRIQGENGSVEGRLVDSVTKEGVKDAKVVIGEALVQTDGSGNFNMTVAEDRYKAAFVCYGYKDKSMQNVDVMAGQTLKMGDVELIKLKAPKREAVNVTIDAADVIKVIDKHKLLGQNLAAWHKPQGYRDPEAISKLKNIGVTFVRIPGGDYGNLYDWRTGDVYRPEGGKTWTPETNYMGIYVPFVLRMETEMGAGAMETLPIINIMTPREKTIEQRIDYAIEWLKDMKAKNIKFRYVEIGNELDDKPDFPGPKKVKGKEWYQTPGDMKVTKWWTSIENYCKVFNYAAKRIHKAFPDVKIMGPVPMQPFNKERLQGEPWKADLKDPKVPYWVEKFLKLCADNMDTLAVHEYPLWANNDARALLQKPQETWPVYMPKFREWIKKYVNSKYPDKKVEVALTEWNSGDEIEMTAQIDNALFCADYLGSFMKQGGDLAFIWDLYTQKPGKGGGHGLLDEENDPTSKYSERGSYWVYDMYNNAFGTKMVKCESDNESLSVYASLVDDNTISVMAINKTRLSIAAAKFKIAGFNAGSSAKVWQLSEREYVWSKELYRPIVNSGPSKFDVNLNDMTYEFPPYSVTVLQLKK